MPPGSTSAKIDEMRLNALERNSEHFSIAITGFITRFTDIEKYIAVQDTKDINTDERIGRIETRLDEIKGLGKWLLATLGALFLALIVNFIFKGGFNLP